MKQVFYLAILLTLFAACGQKKDSVATTDCYIYVVSMDTIYLNITTKNDVVTGTMRYQFFEKDQSSGTISGKIKGDKLVAEYTFSAEGTQSVSEVIFLMKDNGLQVGFGEMEDIDGKMVYKDPEEINFDTFTLEKTTCL